jgi:hypothetical protein
MLEKHKAFAERRGGPNPYKFTCQKCEQLIGLMRWHEGEPIDIRDQKAKCYGIVDKKL